MESQDLGHRVFHDVEDEARDLKRQIAQEMGVEVEDEGDDDSYRVDEDGTEWWQDDDGAWWYRSQGEEDWYPYEENRVQRRCWDHPTMVERGTNDCHPQADQSLASQRFRPVRIIQCPHRCLGGNLHLFSVNSMDRLCPAGRTTSRGLNSINIVN